jgi:hypothetical protein
MPKTLRINRLKIEPVALAEALRESGYYVHLGTYDTIPTRLYRYCMISSSVLQEVIYLDDDFDDLLVIPPQHFADIKKSKLLESGKLIFQVFLANY